MSTALAPSRLEASIDRKAAGEIAVSKSGMVVESMAQVMEIAKLMALGREAIPKHLRENPGACLSIAIQAYEWGISPFALAAKTYVVNDRLAYEASLYQAVITRRAPIKGRIRMSFAGDGAARECRVWAELQDGVGIVDYTSPKFATIQPKNSPLWKNDPDQQLFYFSVRAFARRHFPDVMMGIYTVDELIDNAQPGETVIVQQGTKSDALAKRLQSAREPIPVDVTPANDDYEAAKTDNMLAAGEETQAPHREPGDDDQGEADAGASQEGHDGDVDPENPLRDMAADLAECVTNSTLSDISARYMKACNGDDKLKTEVQIAVAKKREALKKK